MEPVKHARKRKEIILYAWVRSIADKCIDPVFVEGEPGGVKVSYNGSSVDKIAIVEVMIVILDYHFRLSPACSRGYLKP